MSMITTSATRVEELMQTEGTMKHIIDLLADAHLNEFEKIEGIRAVIAEQCSYLNLSE